jgi:hypothetical protein
MLVKSRVDRRLISLISTSKRHFALERSRGRGIRVSNIRRIIGVVLSSARIYLNDSSKPLMPR